MRAKKRLHIPSFDIPLWWPDLLGNWRMWLPSRGNILFTPLMIALLLWAQTAGALPLGVPQSAIANSQSTIPYQGRLADANGNPLTNTVNMIFRLYGQASGGVPRGRSNGPAPTAYRLATASSMSCWAASRPSRRR